MTFRLRSPAVVALTTLLAACGGTGFIGVPFVTSVNGASWPAGAVGSQVVISGQVFGSVQGSSQVLFTNAVGGIALPATITSASNWTDTYIITTVPAGAFKGPVVVSTGGGIGGGTIFTVTPSVPEVPFTPSAVSWTAGSPLPVGVSGNAVAHAQIRTASRDTGFVYSVGGADNTGAAVTGVYYAAVTTTGALGAWTATTALPTGLAFHAAVVATQRNSAVTSIGYLYALGGSTNSSGAVYRAALNADGSVGTWSSIATLPAALHSFAAIIYRGSLYVVGGAANGTNAPVATVYRTPIQLNGSLGFSSSQTWATEGALPARRARLSIAAFGLYLYAIAGDSATLSPNDSIPRASETATVFFGRLSPNSHEVAAWSVAGTLDVARSAHTAVIAGGNILVTGGLYAGASTGTNDESYAALTLADGTIGSFSVATANTIHVFNHGATGYLGGDGTFHVVVAGGDDVNTPGTKHVETFTY